MANISSKESLDCPICHDKFVFPKILPCCHTICKPCIRLLLHTSTSFGKITCPLCQTDTPLNEEGLDSLFDNYFVPLKSEDTPVMFYCGSCMKETALENCAHCFEQLCTDCRSSHRLATVLAGEPWTHFSDDSNGNLNNIEFPEENLSEVDQFPIIPHPLKSQLNAKLTFSISVESLYSSLDRHDDLFSVRSIRQTENNTLLVLLYLGPEVVEYDSTGKEINRHILEEGGTSDIICLPGGNIFYSSLQNGLIMKMDSQKNHDIFAQTVHYQPFSLGFFRDGRIVAGGPAYQRLDSNGHGAILIYDKEGHLKREIVQVVDGMFVKFPISIAVSDCDKICVADKEAKCVFVFSETGSVLSLYDGQFGIEPRDLCPLLPLALCHDNEGNLIIVNALDGMLHVLTPTGDFKGYTLMENSERFGRPSALCIDERKRICVGDMENRIIQFYEISSFKNALDI